MNKRHSLSVWILALALSTATASAGIAAPLNEQIISRFAETWEPLTKRLMAVDGEFDPENLAGLIGQLEQMAQADGPDSDRDKAVQVDGYIDFESWAASAVDVIRAAQWAKDPPQADDIEKVSVQIMADTEMSEEDKTVAIAELKAGYDMAIRQKPAQSDIDIAKRMLPLLEPKLWVAE